MLTSSQENNGQSRRIHEWDSCTDLVIYCIKLGQHDSVDQTRILWSWPIEKRLVELGQLINTVISSKSYKSVVKNLFFASKKFKPSPTNKIKSGRLTETSFASACIKRSLSCILPAVSMSTTSWPSFAAWRTAYFFVFFKTELQQKQNKSSFTWAIVAASFPYPCWNRGTSKLRQWTEEWMNEWARKQSINNKQIKQHSHN